MARRPAKPGAQTPSPGAADIAVEAGSSPPIAGLSPDASALVRQSPIFRSLRDIDEIADPDAKRHAMLDRLDLISDRALGRERTIKNGIVIADPDCNAAVKVEEVALEILGIQSPPAKPRAPDLSEFSQPLKAVK